MTDPATITSEALVARYTYNFAKFTDWPPGSFAAPDAPLNFCILGEDPFSVETLAGVRGQKVRSHPIEVRRYPRVAIVDECHIVFVSRSEQWRLESILEALGSRPILTVSDIAGFSRHGGMITLVETSQRLRFDINASAVNQAGLKISSKLLEMAKTVETNSPGRND